MVPERLELSTFALLVRRSNQLSYGTLLDPRSHFAINEPIRVTCCKKKQKY